MLRTIVQPRGKWWIALRTSSFKGSTSEGGRTGGLKSAGCAGCLSCRICTISGVGMAMEESEEERWTAPLTSPSSIF